MTAYSLASSNCYVKPGSVVADVTYGKGVFWRHIPEDQYALMATDIRYGVEEKAGHLVRMAEGQAVTYKITKNLADLLPIENLPQALRDRGIGA